MVVVAVAAMTVVAVVRQTLEAASVEGPLDVSPTASTTSGPPSASPTATLTLTPDSATVLALCPATNAISQSRQKLLVGGVIIDYWNGTLDTDDDGLPDWWEELYFEGPTLADPAVDSDDDGIADGEPERLLALHTSEHGAHALHKGPDGWWYLIGGNQIRLPNAPGFVPRVVPRNSEGGPLLRFSR